MKRFNFLYTVSTALCILLGAAALWAGVPSGEDSSRGAAPKEVPDYDGESAVGGSKTGCIPVGSLSRDSLAFKGGEKLGFTIHYTWGMINSDVGTAEIELSELDYNGTPAYHCEVSGKTTRLFDLFFKVREDFNSWFTCDGLRPLKFTRDSHEGKYVSTNSYIYDPEKALIYADAYSTTHGQRNVELPWDKCTYDLPSLFFLARNMNLGVVTPEVRYPMTFAIDDDVFNVHFIYYGRETITVKGLGQVKVLRFGARLLAGEVFKSDTDMDIYISDDKNRLPVYFEAPLLVGKASGRMNTYSGLAHPFSALVEED